LLIKFKKTRTLKNRGKRRKNGIEKVYGNKKLNNLDSSNISTSTSVHQRKEGNNKDGVKKEAKPIKEVSKISFY
jgi:hypothetical protein